MSRYRISNKAVILPAANSSSPPIYIPAQTKCVFSLWSPYTDGNGFRCIYSVLIMHRRTDLWGPDGMYGHSLLKRHDLLFYIDLTFPALVFDPDRFLDDRVRKYLTPNPFIFCPFNAGPRICLGQQVCTSHIFRKFQKLKKKNFLSLPIMKLVSSLFAYYSSSLDSLWKSLKISSLRLNGLLVMV